MILIISDSGLCNRLRAVFSHYEYAKSKNQNMCVVWEINEKCNGYFLDYFEPLNNVYFFKSIEHFRKSQHSKQKITLKYEGCGWHKDFTPYDAEKKFVFGDLKLKPFMIDKISNRMKELGEKYIACHVRRTDHTALANSKGSCTKDHEFFNFIENISDKNLKIFIATDNLKTFRTFQNKYTDRIPILFKEQNSSNRRHTSLETAIIDLFTSIYADHFKGSFYSSFTGFIIICRGHKGDSVNKWNIKE